MRTTTRMGLEGDAKRLLRKVPEVTIYFWIIKVLATTVGETAADYLNDTLGFGTTKTTIVMSLLLGVVLVFQFRARRYIPGIYWLAVVLISIVGTLFSDNLVDNLGVPLTTTTIVFSVCLAITFAVWFARERTLSIHSIYTRRREAYYWLAILFTFALGTSAGDLIAEQLNVGYFWSLVMFGGAIGAVWTSWRHFKVNEVLAFWIAYVLTRPLGASIGDWLSQPRHAGGLGLGTTVTSFVFLAAILATVVFLTISKRDVFVTADETHSLRRDLEDYLRTEIREEDANEIARLKHWTNLDESDELPAELRDLVHRLIERHDELVASARDFLRAIENESVTSLDPRPHVERMRDLVE